MYSLFLILTLFFAGPDFAQQNAVSIQDAVSKIIEEELNILEKAGKLKIGDDYIVSKHILSELYTRNDYDILWENPQNDDPLRKRAFRLWLTNIDSEQIDVLRAISADSPLLPVRP